jgi:hypothetical protein
VIFKVKVKNKWYSNKTSLEQLWAYQRRL